MKFVITLCLLASTVLARPQGVDEDYFDPNPQYNFEYKVASDKTQTYINQQEARDGDFVTGQYTYVDPNGALVTVTYEAGPEGYSESRDVQKDSSSSTNPSPENKSYKSNLLFLS
nr:larval cuticle protein A3A-like [Lepeophtheirus salmonis]